MTPLPPRPPLRWLAPEDRVAGVYYATIFLLVLLFGPEVRAHGVVLGWHAAVGLGTVGLAWTVRAWAPLPAAWARLGYVSLTIPWTFTSLGLTVGRIGLAPGAEPADWGPRIRELDRALLGEDPQVLLEPVVTPLLTDAMQLCYFTFYAFALTLAIALLLRGDADGFRRTLLGSLLGFFSSYLGYFLFPASAPFKIPDLMARLAEGARPQGLLLGNFIYDVLGAVEKVPYDCFPSGHVEVTIVVLALARRDHRRLYRVLLPIGAGLVLSTVYLRVHYVVDVLAGAALAAPVVAATVLWDRAWRRG